MGWVETEKTTAGVQNLADEGKDVSFVHTVWSAMLGTNHHRCFGGVKMTRTRGTFVPDQEHKTPPWEPEPLHLPVYAPNLEHARDRQPAEAPPPDPQPSRVIVIDLA